MASAQDINTYIKEFPAFCRSEVMPIMASFEQERLERKDKNNLFLIMILVTAVVIGLFIWLGRSSSFFVYAIFGCIISFIIFGHLMHKNSKDFENKVKSSVMKKLLSFFGDFSWTMEPKMKQDDIKKSKLFHDFEQFYIDDNFEGTYKGQKVTISEVELKKSVRKNRIGNGNGNESGSETEHVTLFKGVFVKISMNKKFESHTVVVDKDTFIEKALKGQDVLVNSLINSIANGGLSIELGGNMSKQDFYKRQKMEPVVLEDPEFCEMFEVYSTDQVDSRYILTTTFIERFKLLSESFKLGCIRTCFLDNSVIFAVPSILSLPDLQGFGVKSTLREKDLFKFGDLNTPMTDTAPLQDFFKQFIAALSLVDSLKLDQKIGL